MLTAIDSWTLDLPMGNELRLGAVRSAAREYVVVRTRHDEGAEGWAFGYTRGTALAETVARLADRLLRARGGDPIATLRPLYPNAWSDVVRAASLIDIAHHQALGFMAHEPARRPPMVCVVGYFPQRGSDVLLNEAAEAIRSGAKGLKFMMSNDPSSDVSLLRELRERFPNVPLGVDAHGLFGTVEAAAEFGSTLVDMGVSFFEDPFRGRPLDALRDLRRRVPLNIAVGEDLTDTDYLADLIGVADIIRLDATVTGGVCGAIEVGCTVQKAGGEVFPHAFPGIHAQIAHALPDGVTGIEYIPVSSRADPIDQLLGDPDPLSPPRFCAVELDRAATSRWSTDAEEKHRSSRPW